MQMLNRCGINLSFINCYQLNFSFLPKTATVSFALSLYDESVRVTVLVVTVRL